MFIDVTNFKKELKASYNGMGVEVIHYADGIVSVSGSGWIIEVDESEITKKFMAALVEHIGPLPGFGRGYAYCNKTQEEIEMEYDEHKSRTTLLERFTEGTTVQDTRLMVQRNSTCYSVFQRIDTMEPMLVRRTLQVMVDPVKVDRERDEIPPERPVLVDGLIIWNNDTMQLAIATTPYHNNGERDFLRLINGKNMCWPFED